MTKSKLAELHQRTDQDLLVLLKTDVQRALLFTNVAGTKGSGFYAKATAIYRNVAKLLPTLPGEQGDLAAKLDDLRRVLEAIPAQKQATGMAACGD